MSGTSPERAHHKGWKTQTIRESSLAPTNARKAPHSAAKLHENPPKLSQVNMPSRSSTVITSIAHDR
ncbi:hypothetical protein V5O48_018569, partial [Marasmius crinis-equi]